MGIIDSDMMRWARGSRNVVLLIVFLSLLLDNLLLTTVVPIIPDYLYGLDRRDQLDNLSKSCRDNNSTTSNKACSLFDASNGTSDLNLAQKILAKSLPVDLISENSKVGWLFAGRSIVQMISNPIVGWSANRVGYSVLMMTGCIVSILSSLLFSLGDDYVSLVVARGIQGVSSACTAVAGMSMVADRYTDDSERSQAMGIALGGIALGTLLGYPFGSFMYSFVGKAAPFLFIAGLTAIDGVLQMLILRPTCSSRVSKSGTSLLVLLRDPYILIASGAIMFTTMAMALLEPTLPIWVLQTMPIQKWQLGLVFLPDSIGYLIGTNMFGVIALKIGRWICAGTSMLMIGLCLTCIPFATNITHLILPHFGLGLGLGITDASIMPHLALLVDRRHVAVYGSVYSIAQVAVCLGYILGPSIGGQVVKTIGFPWLMRGMALLNLLYSPLCYFLSNKYTKIEPEVRMDCVSSTAILQDTIPRLKYTEPSFESDSSFTYGRLPDDQK